MVSPRDDEAPYFPDKNQIPHLQSADRAMECRFDGGRNGDVIVPDPYLFPAAHSLRLAGLWIIAGSGVALALMIWLPCVRFGEIFPLKDHLCLWYPLLTSLGSSVEALATTLLTEYDAQFAFWYTTSLKGWTKQKEIWRDLRMRKISWGSRKICFW